MIDIRLFCNAGMSTSVLVKKMRTEAESRGIDAMIEAFAVTEVKQKIEGADVALIGPQIGYRKDEIQNFADRYGVKVEVIPMRDYGMVRADKVLDLALSILEA